MCFPRKNIEKGCGEAASQWIREVWKIRLLLSDNIKHYTVFILKFYFHFTLYVMFLFHYILQANVVIFTPLQLSDNFS